MTLKIHHLDILDLLILDNDLKNKNEWIDKISQRDLYSIATWLMMNLTPESQGTEHKRSNIRDILGYYYDQMTYHNNPVPWSDRTKWFIGYAVINLWSYRQLDKDPRYQF